MATDTTASGGAAEQTSGGGAANARTVPLPDGRKAKVKQAKGQDLVNAGRMAGGTDPMMIMMGLIAATTTIDGEALTIEEVLELDLGLINPIMQALGGGNALSLPGSTSLN